MFQNLYAGYETYNINHLGILAQIIYQKSNKIRNNKNSLFSDIGNSDIGNSDYE